jgi:hypothetical protein
VSKSFKYLCVVKENVFEIPRTKIRDRKIIKKEFAGLNGLRLEMSYVIKNKKPDYIVRVLFERITFDESGVLDFNLSRLERKRFYDYAFSDGDPLPIPKAAVFPTESELVPKKEFLNRKYPSLLKNDPYAIEFAILESKERYKENKMKFKRSHQLSK